ncbi:MAG: hypothetical protein JST04_10840 [Bdellovibrionales bacterium]|nr:hypothetical protein [Bdellovibrionales bacterium]
MATSNLKCAFSSLSLSASVDQQTGSLSVFDVVDEIRAPQVPIHVQMLVLTLVWEKPKDQGHFDGRVFIHILTPDGKQAMIGNGDLKIPSDQRRVKAIFRLGGFPLMQFGSHRFVVSWVNAAGAKEGENLLDFEVVQVAEQPGPGAGPAGGPAKPGMAH